MSKEGDDFKKAFNALLHDGTLSEALSIATGVFVGLVEAVMEEQGHDTSQVIKIDDGDKRDITIHAAKNKEPA